MSLFPRALAPCLMLLLCVIVPTGAMAAPPQTGGTAMEEEPPPPPMLEPGLWSGPEVPGDKAVLQPDGTAAAPADAPDQVKQAIWAANALQELPYRYGGGHNLKFDVKGGADCSGTVSFALHGAGLLSSSLTSGGFMSWGASGPGRWVTIYASPGHVYMVVAGRRFDTTGRSETGTRWQPEQRSSAGYVVRHPPGL